MAVGSCVAQATEISCQNEVAERLLEVVTREHQAPSKISMCGQQVSLSTPLPLF